MIPLPTQTPEDERSAIVASLKDQGYTLKHAAAASIQIVPFPATVEKRKKTKK